MKLPKLSDPGSSLDDWDRVTSRKPLSLLLVFRVMLPVAWPTVLWSVIVVLINVHPLTVTVSVAFLRLPHTKEFVPKMSEALGALEALQTSQLGRIGKLSKRIPSWPPHSSSVAFSGFDTGP